MPLPPAVLDWLYQRLEHEYIDVHRTFSDTVQLLTAVPSLRPKTDVYTAETGHSELLLNISGPLPTVISGTTYGIPIEIWVPKQYPSAAPLIYVRPTDTMLIQPGGHVDTNGSVHFDWSAVNTLLGLATMLSEVFSVESPVYSRPAPQYEPPQHAYMPQHGGYGGYSPQPQYGASSNQALGGPSGVGVPQGLASPHDPYGPNRSNGHNAASAAQASPQYGAHSEPVNIMDDDKQVSEATKLPPLPPNPQKVDATERLLTVLKNTGAQLMQGEVASDMASLDHTKKVLLWLESALDREKQALDASIAIGENNVGILDARIADAQALSARARQDTETLPPPDELVLADTVVGNQLLQALAQDQAIGDTMIALTRAMEAEKIKLDLYLRHLRSQARDQFMARALALKAADASIAR